MITDLLNVLDSGARSNKYKVYIPMFDELGTDLDLLVQTASLPGKNLTPTEVVIKGRKCMLRGDMSFDGSWTMTFLNTEDMKARLYFLKWIDEISNTNMNTQGILGGLNVSGISVYDIANTINIGEQIAGNPLSLLGGIQPTYQKDIKIEQLNSSGGGEMAVRLIGAFPVTVSPIEYNEVLGEVSSTSITFSYTDIEVENPTKSIVGAIAGDAVANLL